MVSFRERKGRTFKFDPRTTLVRGRNKTGKSSLLKALFSTFGAEPVKTDDGWDSAEVTSLVKFELDGAAYFMLRKGQIFAVFDRKGRLLKRCMSVLKELAPFLADLFDFRLRLPDRVGRTMSLPPAYFFLPFYMDQDGSWNRQWASFSKLGQFANWKGAVTEYHTGMRGNAYYEARARRADAENNLKKARNRREALQDVYARLSERYAMLRFEIDIAAFKEDIDRLLEECERLRAREDHYKAQITEHETQRQSLRSQLAITNHALQEARADFKVVTETTGAEVNCPTCGAGYENSFAERFSIALDEDNCADLAIRLEAEVARMNEKILQLAGLAEKTSIEIQSIERLLAKREGALALSDVIQQESKRELRSVMEGDLLKLRQDEESWLSKIDANQREMKASDTKERRAAISSSFAG